MGQPLHAMGKDLVSCLYATCSSSYVIVATNYVTCHEYRVAVDASTQNTLSKQQLVDEELSDPFACINKLGQSHMG